MHSARCAARLSGLSVNLKQFERCSSKILYAQIRYSLCSENAKWGMACRTRIHIVRMLVSFVFLALRSKGTTHANAEVFTPTSKQQLDNHIRDCINNDVVDTCGIGNINTTYVTDMEECECTHM